MTSNGINVKIIMKRIINNAILTIYLPTFLILIIVYSTNFFKDFFFEAVVSVNLTSLLVLTTLFISVSQSLPPTSYVKMIDIWLIFAQLIPFLEVLLHTWMDMHRVSEDREVNNHGKPRKIENDKNADDKVKNMIFLKVWIENMFSYFYKAIRIIQVEPVSGKDVGALISRNEKVMVDARKDFYENAQTNHGKLLNTGQFIGDTVT